MAQEVRPARPGDAGRLGEIFLASGRAAWAGHLPSEGLSRLTSPAEEWEAQIANPEIICLVAELDGEIAAFAVLCPSPDPDANRDAVALLDRLYADPAAWRKGLGRALLGEAMSELRHRGYRAATLWTATWNRSRGFYEANGWSLDGASRERTFAGGTYTEVRYRIEVNPGTESAPPRSRTCRRA
jgi:GNAT superfamily N-acetyltransferase